MFSFLRNIIGKKSPAPAVAPVPRVPQRPQATGIPTAQPRAVEPVAGVQRVETAQLQLLAIMTKFPEDLRQLVLKMPPETAMVVMPIPAILRFLPTGSVKISLASVVRQAPPGTFSTINPQDKRLVEVPLAEIFKRVSPAILKRRDDQRYSDLANDGFDIFGDDENPHTLAPRVDEAFVAPPPAPAPAPQPVAVPVIPQPRVLQMPSGMPAVAPVARVAPATESIPTPARVPVPPSPFVPPGAPTIPSVSPAAPVSRPAAPEPAAEGNQEPLVLSIRDLVAAWPEPIKSEAIAQNGATVALPAAQVGAGLARGKVAFNWGQIRAWMTPPPEDTTAGADTTELVLPLKVIAPAFLKHSRGGSSAPKKSAAYAEEIPELFAGRNPAPAPTPAPAAPIAPAPVAEVPAPVAAPAPMPKPGLDIPEMLFAPARPKTAPEPEPEPVAPAPTIESEPEAAEVAEEAPAVEPTVSEPEPEAEIPAPAAEVPVPAVEETTPEVEESAPEVVEPEAESTPVVEAAPEEVVQAPVPAVAALATSEPQSLAEAFNQPGKTHWSPSEIVNALAELPQIAGSVVALQEGLVIAHRLPDPLKGEVFAAFLPQIFARINQYSKEMKLGTVDDLIINSHGLPCHLFRMEQVYFAALGKSGEALPTPILRLCAAALAS